MYDYDALTTFEPEGDDSGPEDNDGSVHDDLGFEEWAEEYDVADPYSRVEFLNSEPDVRFDCLSRTIQGDDSVPMDCASPRFVEIAMMYRKTEQQLKDGNLDVIKSLHHMKTAKPDDEFDEQAESGTDEGKGKGKGNKKDKKKKKIKRKAKVLDEQTEMEYFVQDAALRRRKYAQVRSEARTNKDFEMDVLRPDLTDKSVDAYSMFHGLKTHFEEPETDYRHPKAVLTELFAEPVESSTHRDRKKLEKVKKEEKRIVAAKKVEFANLLTKIFDETINPEDRISRFDRETIRDHLPSFSDDKQEMLCKLIPQDSFLRVLKEELSENPKEQLTETDRFTQIADINEKIAWDRHENYFDYVEAIVDGGDEDPGLKVYEFEPNLVSWELREKKYGRLHSPLPSKHNHHKGNQLSSWRLDQPPKNVDYIGMINSFTKFMLKKDKLGQGWFFTLKNLKTSEQVHVPTTAEKSGRKSFAERATEFELDTINSTYHWLDDRWDGVTVIPMASLNPKEYRRTITIHWHTWKLILREENIVTGDVEERKVNVPREWMAGFKSVKWPELPVDYFQKLVPYDLSRHAAQLLALTQQINDLKAQRKLQTNVAVDDETGEVITYDTSEPEIDPEEVFDAVDFSTFGYFYKNQAFLNPEKTEEEEALETEDGMTIDDTPNEAATNVANRVVTHYSNKNELL